MKQVEKTDRELTAYDGTDGKLCAAGDNSSNRLRNCSSTSGGEIALETNFRVPSGANWAPRCDETNFASLAGSISAF